MKNIPLVLKTGNRLLKTGKNLLKTSLLLLNTCLVALKTREAVLFSFIKRGPRPSIFF